MTALTTVFIDTACVEVMQQRHASEYLELAASMPAIITFTQREEEESITAKIVEAMMKNYNAYAAETALGPFQDVFKIVDQLSQKISDELKASREFSYDVG